MALKFDVEPVNAVTTVEILGGTKGAVTLDEDMMFVGLIANKDTQRIQVKVTTDENTTTKTYSLSGLTLAA